MQYYFNLLSTFIENYVLAEAYDSDRVIYGDESSESEPVSEPVSQFVPEPKYESDDESGYESEPELHSQLAPCSLATQLNELLAAHKLELPLDEESTISFAELSAILNSPKLNSKETALQNALRNFFEERIKRIHNNQALPFDYDFVFSDWPIHQLYQSIATLIAQEGEPIICVLNPNLDKNVTYVDSTFSRNDDSGIPGQSLIKFTEITDKNNKKRLKNLKRYILTDDGKKLLDATDCCEGALKSTGDAAFSFSHQFFEGVLLRPEYLSYKEKQRLEKWGEGLGGNIVAFMQRPSAYIITKNIPIWVSRAFPRYSFQPGMLGYELCVLHECLLNGGITRNNIENHLVKSKRIAQDGMDRFNEIWKTLDFNIRNELMYLYINQYSCYFSDVLYSMFPLEENFTPTRSPFVCVEVMANAIDYMLESNGRNSLFTTRVFSPGFVSKKEYDRTNAKNTSKIKEQLKR